jgi:uncharacterized protein (TIGR02145 family)
MKIKKFLLFAALSFSVATAQEDFVLINGVKWATRNVDVPGVFTANPEDTGMFYQWNCNIGWSAADPMINSSGKTSWKSSTDSIGTVWETANSVCPEGYRVPTYAEIQRLLASDNKWTNLNGVNGRSFGNGSNSIFLPAAGYRYDYNGTLNLAGSSGSYWSSSQNSNNHPCCLYFGSSGAGSHCDYRIYGQSVRCVRE